MSFPLLLCQSLCKEFAGHAAVSDVGFCVNEPQILGLLGTNGAGKTTTLRLLAGSLRPTSGRVCISGFDLSSQPQQARANIGYVPQNPPLYPELRAREYLDFVARVKGGVRSAELEQIIEELGLAAIAHRRIAELSRGFQQRLALAQAILGTPSVLILDEPTTGLDPRQLEETRSLLRRLGRNQAVILSTHLLQEASAICDRLIILSRGHVVADRVLQRNAEKLIEQQMASIKELFLSLSG